MLNGMNFRRMRWATAGVLCTVGLWASGQTTQTVQILRAQEIRRHPSLPGIQRLLGDVQLGWRSTTLTCDSAWRFDDGAFEVMGRVVMVDGRGGRLFAERMQLDPVATRVEAQGGSEPVRWKSDGETVSGAAFGYGLETRDLVWNQTAQLTQRDSLTGKTRQLSSMRGQMLIDADQLNLGGNVQLEDEDQLLRSDSLQIFQLTAEQQWVLCGPTSLWSRDGAREFHADAGTLNLAGGSGQILATGDQRAWFRQEDVISAGDALTLVDSTHQTIRGRVFVTDTLASFGLWGDALVMEPDAFWLTGSGADDRAHVSQGQEQGQEQEQERGDDAPWWVVGDTIWRTSGPQGYIMHAWPDARMAQGTSRGACDTLVWTEADSILTFLGMPVLFADGSRLTSDSLRLQLMATGVDSLVARGHVCMTSALEEGPDSLHHTISGRSLDGFFGDEGALDQIRVAGNSEVLQFDDDGMRLNHLQSSRLNVDFADGEVQDILLLGQPSGVWTSTNQADQTALPGCPHLPPPADLAHPVRPQLQSRHKRLQTGP